MKPAWAIQEFQTSLGYKTRFCLVGVFCFVLFKVRKGLSLRAQGGGVNQNVRLLAPHFSVSSVCIAAAVTLMAFPPVRKWKVVAVMADSPQPQPKSF